MRARTPPRCTVGASGSGFVRSGMFRWDVGRTRHSSAGEERDEGEHGQRRPRPSSLHRTRRSQEPGRDARRPSHVRLRGPSPSRSARATIGTSGRESRRIGLFPASPRRLAELCGRVGGRLELFLNTRGFLRLPRIRLRCKNSLARKITQEWLVYFIRGC